MITREHPAAARSVVDILGGRLFAKRETHAACPALSYTHRHETAEGPQVHALARRSGDPAIPSRSSAATSSGPFPRGRNAIAGDVRRGLAVAAVDPRARKGSSPVSSATRSGTSAFFAKRAGARPERAARPRRRGQAAPNRIGSRASPPRSWCAKRIGANRTPARTRRPRFDLGPRICARRGWCWRPFGDVSRQPNACTERRARARALAATFAIHPRAPVMTRSRVDPPARDEPRAGSDKGDARSFQVDRPLGKGREPPRTRARPSRSSASATAPKDRRFTGITAWSILLSLTRRLILPRY